MRKDIHYFGLDILRLLAASLVLLDHFGLYGWAAPSAMVTPDQLAFPALKGMGSIGSIGVEIFFLISGFVIAASAKGNSANQFICSRAIRVFPALWICGIIAFVARAATGEPIGVLVRAFLHSAILSPAGPYIDGVVWTLVIEAVFYLLIFAVLLRGGFAKIELVAKGLGLVSMVFLTVMAVLVVLAETDPRFVSLAALCDRFPTKVLLLRHGVFFALGMLLWSGFDTRFTRARIAWMAMLATFCTIEIAINRGGLADVAIAAALWWAGLAIILLSIAKARWIHDRLRRGTSVVKDMGRLSYPLYLNHYTLGLVLVPVLAAHGLSRPAVLVLSMGFVILSSYLVMRYPERAAQKFLRARLAGFLERDASPQLKLGPTPFYFR